MGHLESLEELYVNGTGIRELPSSIGMLERLLVLNLKDCKHLVSLPSNVYGLKSLKELDLSGCSKLDKLPDELGHINGLEKLDVSETDIRELPSSIGMLERLRLLNLKDCKHLVSFPSSVNGLKSLRELDLSCCSKLDKLPDELGHVNCLEKLDVSSTSIRELPSSIGLLKNLKILSLRGCKGQSPKSWNPFRLLLKRSYVPAVLSLPCLSGLHSLTKLDLSDCNLFEVGIPSDVGCLSSLRKLNLSRNQFVGLPKSIWQLSKLVELHLAGCHKLRTLSGIPSHVWINVSDCISLDTLSNPIEQCNSVVSGANCFNCFKMVENECSKSVALSLLSNYLQGPQPQPGAYGDYRFDFVAPGNEIPEWYNNQSKGSSIIAELHPGWFSNKWIGCALCAVFRLRKPLLFEMDIYLRARVEGQSVFNSTIPILRLGDEWGQPVLDTDHIWLLFLHRRYPLFVDNWQDIYGQLKFSFETWSDGGVEVNKCGVRMVYEEDVEELRHALWNKESNVTKRGLQHYDHTATLSQDEEEQEPHPKRSRTIGDKAKIEE